MAAVSVIIPVYKVEKYLRRCAESVLAQDEIDFELILVDDGSPDCCPAMCDEFARADARVKVIHKENGGLSSARNVGTAVACGDFIFYLDSDDYLEDGALRSILNTQKETASDVVVGNYFYTYEDHENLAAPNHGAVLHLTNQEAMERLVTGKIQTFAWGKLIRREIAQKYAFPVGRLFEDHFWTHLIFAEAQKVAVMDKPLVHYIQRDESISYSINLKRLDILDGWRERENFIREAYPSMLQPYMEHIASRFLEVAWLCQTKMQTNKCSAFDKLRQFNTDTGLLQYAHGYDRFQIQTLQMSRFLYFVVAAFGKVFHRIAR